MTAFTFAEISLTKKCFRVVRIIAEDVTAARRKLPGGDWAWGFLGEELGYRGKEPTKAERRRRRPQLIWTREEWSVFVKRFGLTAESAEARIKEATTIPRITNSGWWSS